MEQGCHQTRVRQDNRIIWLQAGLRGYIKRHIVHYRALAVYLHEALCAKHHVLLFLHITRFFHIACKDSANRAKYKEKNVFFLLFPRCSLSSPKVKVTNKRAKNQRKTHFSLVLSSESNFSRSEKLVQIERKGSANRYYFATFLPLLMYTPFAEGLPLSIRPWRSK